MDIDTISAGKELDGLIAERVFGWKNLVWKEGGHKIDELGNRLSWPMGWYGDGPRGSTYLVKRYSTNMDDAWEVVDKLRETCCDFSISEGFNAAFLKDDWIVATADTVPVAICRAALKTVMEK